MRVLLLGPTGVDKNFAISRLQDLMGDASPNYVKFESEFISPIYGNEFYRFLDENVNIQKKIWIEAWRALLNDPRCRDGNVIVGLHAVYTRPLYGCRSVISIPEIAKFNPNIIITLIDDVYFMWHRTQIRAHQGSEAPEQYIGVPTIPELLETRAIEIFMANVICCHCDNVKKRNYLVAARHPANLLRKVIFHSKEAKTSYLSFPISKPRKLMTAGNAGGINAVNKFLKAVSDSEAQNERFCFFCPLSIDELPLIGTLSQTAGQEYDFDIKQSRWDTSVFWPINKSMIDMESLPLSMKLSTDEIRKSMGMISSELDRRDCRLVEQSDRMVVWNPIYRLDLSANPSFDDDFNLGIQKEMQVAIRHDVPMVIYQDPIHDPSGILPSFLGLKKTGSLGAFREAKFARIIQDETEFLRAVFA